MITINEWKVLKLSVSEEFNLLRTRLSTLENVLYTKNRLGPNIYPQSSTPVDSTGEIDATKLALEIDEIWADLKGKIKQ